MRLVLSRPRLIGVALALLSLVSCGVAAAQGRADAERMTQDLRDLSARHAMGDAAARRVLAVEMAALARERRALLASLIDTDPDAVLGNALTADDVAAIPAGVQPLVEQETETDGSLEVLYEDRVDGSELKVFLNTGTERLRLRSARRLPQLQTHTRVRVRGVKMNGALALSGATSVQTLSLPISNTFGEQTTLVLLINFQNDPANMPYTPATAANTMFNVTSAWDMENSFQQTWLTGDAFGWFTIALNNTGCDYLAMASLARQAATNAGVNVASYERYVYAFPFNNNCAFWGLGSVGGSPSHAWINGQLALQVLAHEMGHNFGLYHSHALDCGVSVLGPPCTSIGYGDPVDVMGGATGHFTAFQKERLGWLNYGSSPPITEVTSSGTYTIEPYASPAMGVKALKILKSTSPPTWYYVEHRRAIGADSFLSAPFFNMQNGVVLHTGSSSSGDTSFFLDATPANSTFQDGAFVVGTSFTDAFAGVTITPLSVGASGAVVSITLSEPACTRQYPTVTLGPASGPVLRGTRATFNASVTNNDTTACGSSAFNLQVVWPAGWAGWSDPTSVPIAPESSATATVTLTSPSTAAAGSYLASLTAINSAVPSFAGSATTTATIVTSCTFTLSPTSQSLPSGGGTGSVSVATNAAGCVWTATTTATWISITSGASGNGAGTVGYTVLPNTTTSTRSGTLKAGGKTVTISQAGVPPCAYTVAPTTLSLSSGATTGTVAVTTTSACAWTAISNASWISVTSGASGTGSGAVEYSVLPNILTTARTSSLKVAGKTVTVTQAAAPPPCVYAVSPASASIAVAGGSGNVSVTTTSACSWTAMPTETWISVTSGTSGTGSGTVAYAVAENTTGIARGGELTIAGRTVAIAQAGVAPPAGTFTDDFARAVDSTTLGNGWEEVLGDLQTANGVLTNAAQNTYHLTVAPLTGAELSAGADFAFSQQQGAPRFGVVLRYQDPSNYYLMYRMAGGASLLRISKIVDGVETVLKSASLANPATNVFFRVDGGASGTTLTLSLDGVVKLTVTDGTFESGGVGLLMGSTLSHVHRADNFEATAQ